MKAKQVVRCLSVAALSAVVLTGTAEDGPDSVKDVKPTRSALRSVAAEEGPGTVKYAWGESEFVPVAVGVGLPTAKRRESSPTATGNKACNLTYQDGRRYKGECKPGKQAGKFQPHGYGVMTWPDRKQHEGGWRNGREHGHGVTTWPNNFKRVEGEWANGDFDGYIVRTESSGARKESTYSHGRFTRKDCLCLVGNRFPRKAPARERRVLRLTAFPSESGRHWQPCRTPLLLTCCALAGSLTSR